MKMRDCNLFLNYSFRKLLYNYLKLSKNIKNYLVLFRIMPQNMNLVHKFGYKFLKYIEP